MSRVDLALVGLVLLGAIWGMVRGAWSQLLDACIWAAMFATAALFAGSLAHGLQEPLGVSFPATYAFSCVALALLTQIAVRLMVAAGRSYWARRQTPKAPTKPTSPSPNPIDRVLGALLGAAKIAAIVWIGLSIAIVANGLLAQHGMRTRMEHSALVQMVAEKNALTLLFDARLRRLGRALQEKSRSPAWQEFMKDQQLASLAGDQQLMRELREGDLTALGRSSALLSLVTDASWLAKLDHALDDRDRVAGSSVGTTR